MLYRYLLVIVAASIALKLTVITAIVMTFNVNTALVLLPEEASVVGTLLIVSTMVLTLIGGLWVTFRIWSVWNRARLFLLTPKR